MTKNPIINALCASFYILVVVTTINLASQHVRNKPDTFFAPVAFLSLFTLSVVTMAFIFFYQPLQLFVKGKRNEAVKLFAQTAGVFAGITLIVLALVFSGII